MPRLTQKFRAKPGHIAVCHAFADTLDRRQALNGLFRTQMAAEHRAMAAAFDLLIKRVDRFADTLSHLDADRICNLALQANVLQMTFEARAGFSTRYDRARRMDAVPAEAGTLQARLNEPLSLPRIVDVARFEELQDLRHGVYDLIQDLSDRMTRLYYETPKMTIGELESTLRGISRDAGGQVVVDAAAALPVPAAA